MKISCFWSRIAVCGVNREKKKIDEAWREDNAVWHNAVSRAHSTSPTVTCFLSGHASQDAWLQDMSGRFSRGKIPRSLSPISGEEGPANCLAVG